MIDVQPKDPSKGHFYVSMVKSFLRILAALGLMYSSFTAAAILFIAAEVLGVVEELV